MPSVFAGSEDLPFSLLGGGLPTLSSNIPDSVFSRAGITSNSNVFRTAPWRTSLNTGWLSVAVLTSTLATGSELVRVNTAAGTGIVRLYSPSTGLLILQRWNGADWVDIGDPSAFSSPARLTVHWHRASSGGQFYWQSGDSVVESYSGDTAGDAADHATFHIATSVSQGISEVIVADEDCSNWRLLTLPPNAAGTYQEQASGAYTGIDEITNSDADLVSLDSAGDRFSAALSNVPGSIDAMVCESVWVATRARRDAAGPQSLEVGVRAGGTDSYASPVALDTSYGQILERFPNLPGGGSPPTLAHLNDYELIVRAAT